MKKIYQSLFAFPFLAMIFGCQTSAQSSLQNLTPLQAQEWLQKNPQGQLIDVRTPEEYGQEHLKGAKLIPLQELDKRVGEIKKDQPILLYCHSGRRSLQALNLLKTFQFKSLFHIAGGMTAWKEAKLPVETGVSAKPH